MLQGHAACSAGTQSCLPQLLVYYDANFDDDANMLLLDWENPGYHSRIPTGGKTHPTRESLIYALALLQRGASDDDHGAAEIIRTVMVLQNVDPAGPSFGTWPWLLEEPIDQMSSPDLNWADFCGVRLHADMSVSKLVKRFGHSATSYEHILDLSFRQLAAQRIR